MKMMYEAKVDKLPVKVYMDFINYLGEVNESHLIAQFRNMSQATKNYIAELKSHEDKITRIRVVEE